MGSAEQPPGYAGGQPHAAGDWEAAGLGARVNEIVDAVEREAAKLRQEAEQEAAEIRHQAQEEARRYVDHARQQSQQLAQQRMQQIHELSDALMRRAEEVLERLEYAVPVKEGFENLVRALGETAERLAKQDYDEFTLPEWQGPGAGATTPQQPPAYSTPSTPAPGATSYGGEAPPAGYQPPGPTGAAAPTPTPGPAPAQQGSAGWQELDDAHRVAIQMAAGGSTRGEVEAHLAQTPAPTRASVLDEIFGQGSPPETRVPWAAPQR
jgi:hypothetical protein